jgi:hypothetical protein
MARVLLETELTKSERDAGLVAIGEMSTLSPDQIVDPCLVAIAASGLASDIADVEGLLATPSSNTTDNASARDVTGNKEDGIVLSIFEDQSSLATITASGEEPATPLSNLSDGNSATPWEYFAAYPHWIKYDFGVALGNIKNYAMLNPTGAFKSPRDWTLSWSNDDISYTVIDTRSGERLLNGIPKLFNCQYSVAPCRYWKFDFTAGNTAGGIRIHTLEVYLTTLRNIESIESLAKSTLIQSLAINVLRNIIGERDSVSATAVSDAESAMSYLKYLVTMTESIKTTVEAL